MEIKQTKKCGALFSKLPLLISIVILALCAYGAFWFMRHKPKAGRKRPPELTPAVEVITLEPRDADVMIPVMGTVLPAVEIVLRPRISGEVVRVHPDFEPGGLVKKGELLVSLDKSDYVLELEKRKAELAKARAELETELGQMRMARKQYRNFDSENRPSPEDEALILRIPQEKAARADLNIAEAALKQAELNIERTEIRAPFDSLVRKIGVQIADQANTQTELATLVSTESYWIRCSIPAEYLRRIKLPDAEGKEGSPAELQTGGTEIEGRVIRVLGDIEEDGRLARIIVEIKDPLSKSIYGRLLLGDLVRLNIKGKTLEDVFEVPFEAYRNGREIWLLDDRKRLRIFTVEAAWSDRKYVYIDKPLPDNCRRLVVSSLGFPVDGMALRIAGENKPEKAGVKNR